MKKYFRFSLSVGMILLAVSFLTACDVIPNLIQTPSPEATEVPPTSTPTPTEPVATSSEPITLLVWLPPKFDPASGSESGIILRERLESYADAHPGLRVLVRVKSETGTASMLNALHATTQAAAVALPDLVLLANSDITKAADANLIFPFPAGYPAEDDADWYEAAEKLSTHNQQRFGLPLAADALVMAYKPNQLEEVPANWEDILNSGNTLYFPAASANAKFTLANYIASEGSLIDEAGNVTIQEGPLNDVLEFYAQASENGVLPFWLTNYDTDDLSWENFSEGSAVLAVTSSHRYLINASETINANPLPTPSGIPFTLIDGWLWAISAQDPNRQAAAAELASYLSEADFASEWTQAAGYLPLRPSALSSWEEGPQKILGGKLLPVAEVYPSPGTMAQVTPAISAAVVSLLKGDLTAPEALQQIMASIGQ